MYTLILDTFAHSKPFNGYYKREGFQTLKAAKQAMVDLLANDTVTMDIDGQNPVKIYCAFIAKKARKEYTMVKRTDDGKTWKKHSHPQDRYPMDTMVTI